MFRYILVPATGAASDVSVFRTALAIARLDAGHLAFLHVRQDMQQMVLSIAGGGLGGAGYGGVIDSVQGDVEARQASAHHMMAAFCGREQVMFTDTSGCPRSGRDPYRTREQTTLIEAGAGSTPSAAWHVEAGDESQCLAAHGRTADLTVLGRAHDGERVALHLMEAVLLDSGRPLLIAPEIAPPSVGHHIAIAWKDTAEAARAVAAALPLLARAETVTVVAVQESSDTHSDSDSGKRLCQALRWHNPATTLRVLPRSNHDPVEALLSAVEADGADLLVMGGYSHSRMREAMFGGFTRRVLLAAALPVLMAH
jgi:nucleotide-binding universal stress UspA family protein